MVAMDGADGDGGDGDGVAGDGGDVGDGATGNRWRPMKMERIPATVDRRVFQQLKL
jgi:hypothetical protein